MRFSTLFSLAVAVASASATPTYSRDCVVNPDVRYEWRSLNATQKKAWIDAVKCLATKPHTSALAPTGATAGIPPVNTSGTLYDDFVYAHMDSNVKDHFTGIFFPWHRWFLHTFEDALQNKCNYTGTLPFWDWSLDTDNPIPSSSIFNSSAIYGLGTFGTNVTGWEVRDGAFGNTTRAYPNPHKVGRRYNATPFSAQIFPFTFTNPNMLATEAFTPAAVQAVVDGSEGNYTDFAYKIDGVRAQGMHNAAHIMMGGDMSNPLVSPNDPLFYLHHANLDCIWSRWQTRRAKNLLAYGGGLTQDLNNYDIHPVGADPPAVMDSDLPTVGLSPAVKVKDVFITRNDYLCYKCQY